MYFVIGAVAVSMLYYLFAVAAERPGGTAARVDLASTFGGLPTATIVRRALAIAGWIVLFLGFVWIIGMLPAIFIFIVAYMRVEGREGWGLTLTVAAAMTAASYILFDQLLHIVWPRTVLGQALPALRDYLPSL
jgi:hypothetical protein